ncbi:MAG: hypothetical protein HY067_13470 [Betaproteobacteria bacterium]|nr:hypothetical protein [Betaproteobacteria bacterium]
MTLLGETHGIWLDPSLIDVKEGVTFARVHAITEIAHYAVGDRVSVVRNVAPALTDQV